MEKGMRVTYNTSPMSEELYIYEIGTQICFPEKPVVTHVFEYNTIHFVISGEGWFEGQLLRAGEGFVVKQGQLAVYQSNPENPWVYYWMNASGTASDEVFSRVGFSEKKKTFKYSRIKEISALFEEIIEGEWEYNDKHLILNSYFYNIMSILSKDFDELNFSSVSYSRAEEHFKNALRFIANNFSKHITIEDIANAENVERHYLNKLFKKYSDRSPQAHLIDCRIRKAQTLLWSTDFSVSTIAASVGYDDVLQFSRIFKKKVGVSPKFFRNERKDRSNEFQNNY